MSILLSLNHLLHIVNSSINFLIYMAFGKDFKLVAKRFLTKMFLNLQGEEVDVVTSSQLSTIQVLIEIKLVCNIFLRLQVTGLIC